MNSNKMKAICGITTALALSVSAAGCGSSTDKIRDYDIDKYVTLGSYEGMNVEVAGDFEVSEEDVLDYINKMMAYYPSYEDTDKKVVENGDCVNIDYEGKKDGVAFEGGTAQGYVLEIGSHTFIDGFEDGLIGVKVGDTVDLDLTFPENYQSKDLAGAAVVFTVKVNKIVEKQTTDFNSVTDEYVKSNFNYESKDAFKTEVTNYMQVDCEKNRIAKEREETLNVLLANSKIIVPDGLLDMKVDQYIQQFTRQNCTDEITLADYLTDNYNMSEEEFRKTITDEMEANLNDELVLQAVAKAEGLKLDEEVFAKYVSSAMKSGNYSTEDELYAAYDSDYEDGKTFLQNRCLMTETLTKIVEKSSVSYTDKE